MIAALAMILFLGSASRASAIQFLPEWRPFDDITRFALHGDYQLFGVLNSSDDTGAGRFRLLNTLTLDSDLQLTATLRFHARWRPIENQVIYNSEGGSDRFARGSLEDETLERVFFEVKLLNLIDAAGGRVPLLFHNLYMAEDDVVGLLIAKNNIALGALPNARVLVFGTVLGKDSELDRLAGQRVGLYGIDAAVDTSRYIIEATFGSLSNAEFDSREERHAGLSITRIEQRQSTSLRGLFSDVQTNRHSGGLVILEHSYVLASRFFDRPTVYLNGFYGTADYLSMAS
ncbi:MAG: hypothetical protein AB1515_06360, partial [Nitrospirota bacterium]